ncbi:transposase [Sphingobium sp. MI1205]|uniref:transposase n=1 Tax=Sphingobium sp. MI1205 TaxID=407020 RepID=UPI00077066D9|nr:transposase [Sphingobium sp. MI1205]AMK18950.1 transposase, IS4 [Sphingobium sp. MI1205]
MGHRSIGQERFGFVGRERTTSSLDALASLIDWNTIAVLLDPLYPAAKGEPAWPPLAMFKALLLSIWYDLSDVKLAEALDDRASFRRFCGFAANEATPERTAFVRFRRLLVADKLDRTLFEAVTMQLRSRAVTVKTGTLVDATVIASATEDDDVRRAGSSIRESGLFTASRLMSAPMLIRR